MPVSVTSRTITTGSLTPGGLDSEENIINIAAQAEFYTIEGYIDMVNLAAGDVLVVREKMSGDGTNLRLADEKIYTDAQTKLILRFHTKSMKGPYRVTIEFTDGVARAVPYWFIALDMAVS